MDRRAFFAAALSVLAAPLAVGAQPGTPRVYRLGLLIPSSPPPPTNPPGVFSYMQARLRELGYVEGQNLVIERRYAEDRSERLPELAQELVRLKADVIVAVASAVQAATAATTTIPIVMFTNYTIGSRFVASLARPGGNITGVLIATEGTLVAKRLELLKEAVPRARRIAVLSHGDASSRTMIEEAEKAARALGVKLIVVDVRNRNYDDAFARVSAERPDALFVLPTTFFFRDMKPIIDLAGRHRLPAIYEWREQVEAGGLMAYGSNLSDLGRRVTAYVDRLFKGTKPADLPVEQPTSFELVINVRTAKALQLTIPPSVLARADTLIE
jgi:putative tryptophan/tyrosine transport system substrate-binding protein